MEKFPRSIAAGIFFLTAANISLEIIATRFFAVTQSYHLAFFVLSIAFLGFGAGGCFFYWKSKFSHHTSPSSACVSALFFSLSTLVCVPLMNLFPFDLFELLWAKGRFMNLGWLTLLLGLPFFFSGWTIATVVTAFAPRIRLIYACDLTGAALGAFLPSLLFLPKGDAGSFVLVCLLVATAALFFSLALEKRAIFPGIFLFSIGFIIFILSPRAFQFRLSPYKPLNQALQAVGSKLLLTKWNAISRVDVVSSPSLRFAPGLSLASTSQLPEQLGIFIDGDQPSALTYHEPGETSKLSFLDDLPSSLPFHLLSSPSILVIEPRGGLEILSSIYHKARKIKVIESNPAIPNLLRRELKDKGGKIIADERIEVLVSFPRAAIRQDKEFYDLIILAQPDIFAATGTGLASLQEDNLHTRESFIQILNRLTPGGILVATSFLLPPPRTELRLLATMVESMEAVGLAPKKSLVILLSWGTVTFISKKGPFSPEEIAKAKSWAQPRLFSLAYFPGITSSGGINPLENEAFPLQFISELLDPFKRHLLYRKYLFEIRPASDNRPFFQNSIKLSRLRETYHAFNKKILPLLQGGALYPLLLGQVTLMSSILLLFPLVRLGKKTTPSEKRKAFRFVLPYFVFIGAGFMTFEVWLIQKGILFLGHPLYAVSVVLFALLFSSGMGSLFSGRLAARKFFPGWFLVACFFVILIDSFLLPLFLDRFLSQLLFKRIILAIVSIFPAGFFLGFPFPAGIARLERFSSSLIPLAWSANAFSSVVSAVLAAVVAVSAGYTSLSILASIYYILAFFLFYFSSHRDKPHP